VNINTTEEQLEHTGGCSYGVRIGDPELRVGDRVRATDEPRYGPSKSSPTVSTSGGTAS
jgi:hypothetical protein